MCVFMLMESWILDENCFGEGYENERALRRDCGIQLFEIPLGNSVMHDFYHLLHWFQCFMHADMQYVTRKEKS